MYYFHFLHQNENTQISNIERREAGTLQEIAELQRKLIVLQEHKQEFKDKITSHQGRIYSEQRKTALINNTLADIESQLDGLNS